MDNRQKSKLEGSEFFNISVKSVATFQSTARAEVKTKKTLKDLDLRRHFEISQRSYHNLIMTLIKIKETSTRKGKIKRKTKDAKYKITSRNIAMRSMSIDSSLELDIDSLTNLRKRKRFYKIQGIHIVQNIPEKLTQKEPKPILFQTKHEKDPLVQVIKEAEQAPDQGDSRGVIRYQLSNRSFIDKGWTVLPIEKVVRKMNIYRMRPAHPEFDWFAHNKSKDGMTYDTGEKLAVFDDNGRGRWYYKNGRLALEYYDSEEANCQQRLVVYSSGEPDEKGRSLPVTLLAMFDYLGNGVVFDHAGKIRLKYNQSEGVVLDRELGPVSHWKWHSLNDPPVLQRVMMETYMKPEEPEISKFSDSEIDHRPAREENVEILTIEFDNCIKEQERKKAQKFRPYQIKMKALKINDQFALRVIDQSNVYLTFKDGSAHLKLNLGMNIDNTEIISTETEDAGSFSNSLDKVRDQTDSVINLQRKLENVRKLDHARTVREQKIRPTMSRASADRLTDAASRPLYTLRTVKSLPCNTISNERYCRRKPPYGGVYYDTRLN